MVSGLTKGDKTNRKLIVSGRIPRQEELNLVHNWFMIMFYLKGALRHLIVIAIQVNRKLCN